jgi:hypothetical protein
MESADLGASSAAPAGDQQRAALQGESRARIWSITGSSWWWGMNRGILWTPGGMSAWVMSPLEGMSSHSASVACRKNTATTEMMPVW